MKTIIIGDIHGRPYWRQIIDIEQPDKVVFLGDFVTTHENYTAEQQLVELRAILDYAEDHNCIIIRGNHDTQALGYYWARCHPVVTGNIREYFGSPKNRDRFLKLSQWCHVLEVNDKKYICSHAGISKKWLSEILKLDLFNEATINAMEPSEKFGFTGDRWDNYGTSSTQSCTWIRPQTLANYAVEGYSQIVGHTGTGQGCVKVELDGIDLWLCDALQQGGYLVIENDNFIPKQLKLTTE